MAKVKDEEKISQSGKQTNNKTAVSYLQGTPIRPFSGQKVLALNNQRDKKQVSKTKITITGNAVI